MKIAIMQPYFFPYIGYFQLLNAVDIFVIYDNIQYTKKGWINRNRILVDKKVDYFTLPLKKNSDYLDIVEREISINWKKESIKSLNKIEQSYSKAPYFEETFDLIKHCFEYNEKNLFEFILFSTTQIINYLEIKTKIIKSSEININHDLKSEVKIIEICRKLNSNNYINPIGGLELYDKNNFKKESIDLQFLKSNDIKYKQFEIEFQQNLSIIDLMMFNSKEQIINLLNKEYKLI